MTGIIVASLADPSEACLICHDGLGDNTVSHRTRTGEIARHFFLRPCLNGWLETIHQGERPTQCPYCRIDLKNPSGEETHPAF